MKKISWLKVFILISLVFLVIMTVARNPQSTTIVTVRSDPVKATKNNVGVPVTFKINSEGRISEKLITRHQELVAKSEMRRTTEKADLKQEQKEIVLARENGLAEQEKMFDLSTLPEGFSEEEKRIITYYLTREDKLGKEADKEIHKRIGDDLFKKFSEWKDKRLMFSERLQREESKPEFTFPPPR